MCSQNEEGRDGRVKFQLLQPQPSREFHDASCLGPLTLNLEFPKVALTSTEKKFFPLKCILDTGESKHIFFYTFYSPGIPQSLRSTNDTVSCFLILLLIYSPSILFLVVSWVWRLADKQKLNSVHYHDRQNYFLQM